MFTLAIDFGTSNSAVAVHDGSAVRRIPVAEGEDTLPTAVFFPADKGAMRIGQPAVQALIEGEEGRFMRALKSILGTALFHEPRLIAGRRRTLAEVVTAFLADLRTRAEARTGLRFTRALSGRPVHFHNDPERDARAEEDLRGCYLGAGFTDVAFMFEPEAAALAAQGLAEGTGLIVDIGGGTSDFSVFRVEEGRVRILASHGLRLGGTDFDQTVSMSHAMPLLGHGGALTRSMGKGLLPVPNAVYLDLATWARIPFVYSPETRRLVADMLKHAVDARAIGRLQKVIGEELGHSLAFAVEKGKIAANSGANDARINMTFIERGLAAPIGASSLEEALAGQRAPLRMAMEETLRMAGLGAAAIDSVVLVGGSSLMGLVTSEALALCPGARQLRAEAFTAVVDGLAIASRPA